MGVVASPCSSLSGMLLSSSYHLGVFAYGHRIKKLSNRMMIYSIACLFLFETRNHIETTKAVANQLVIMLSALVVLIAVQKSVICN